MLAPGTAFFWYKAFRFQSNSLNTSSHMSVRTSEQVTPSLLGAPAAWLLKTQLLFIQAARGLSWCLLCVLLWCISGFSSTWTIFSHLHVNSARYQTLHLHNTFLNSFVHTLIFGVVAPIVSAIYSVKLNCTLQLTQMKGGCYTHDLQQDFMQLPASQDVHF